MALTASRAQTERNSGDSSNSTRAIYWLETGRIRVDSLFSALGRNADTTARKLAQEMMAEAEMLTAEEVALTALPDERGSDLTSGRQDKRLCFGGTVEQVTDQASK